MADTSKQAGRPSVNKTMEHAMLVVSKKESGNEEAAYRDFYNALCASPRLGKPIAENDFTLPELMGISRHMYDNGLCWEKHIFMPIYIYCRVKPLRYVIKNRDALLGKLGQEAFLGAYMRLKKFFIKFLG